MTGSNEPGVTTLRIPDMNQQQQQSQQQQHQQQPREQYARETDIEVCFVCKKCRVAFSSESYLLTHQRQCFGGNLDNRGAYRLVQLGYECKICPGDRYKSQYDYKKHSECETHCFRVQQQQQHQQQQQQHKLLAPPPPSESPLSHEMEDVVNQITLLAARAAQEAGSDTTRGTVDSNSNTFCQPGEPKRRFLTPAGDVPQQLTSAGH